RRPRARSSPTAPSAAGSRGSTGASDGLARPRDHDARAAESGRLDARAAAVQRRDARDDREPETVAARAAAAAVVEPRERLERLLALRFRDAGTVVLDGERVLALAGLELDHDAARRIARSVDEQVARRERHA